MNILCKILDKHPSAAARVKGSEKYADIDGTVTFYQLDGAVLVQTEVTGLPSGSGKCDSPVFGFHIHGGTACSGTKDDPFSDAKAHYNPNDCEHPYHAGDMPPLFGVNGNAISAFLTDRFAVKEVIGKAVIIHAKPDDFMTQPSGNSGEKIACGIIEGNIN